MKRKVCDFDVLINNLIDTSFSSGTEIVYSDGLEKHLLKSKHENCIKYIPILENMILTAEYIGQNKKHGKNSFELVKIFDENILIAIKFDCDENNLYVASIYDINNSKLQRRLNSGRYKEYKKI